MFEASDPPEIVLFFGRFHPLLVHLPIGFLLIGLLLEFVSRLPRYHACRHAVSFILFLGAGSAILAATAGYLLSLDGGYDKNLLTLHQWLGIGVSLAAIAALIVKRQLNKKPSPLKERFYIFTFSMAVILMLGAGHYGGSLTHGSDYLTTYLPALMGKAATKKEVKVIANLPEALVYPDIIQPIFDSRCTSCHNGEKKKGDLRLDTFEGLRAGGEGGAVLSAGFAEKSELYKRLLLPPEDEDAMPPKGKEPLTETELQLIAWWINEGDGKADKKVKELAQDANIKLALENLLAAANQWVNPVFEKTINPASTEALAKAGSAGFVILPLSKGQPFVRAQLRTGAQPPKELSALAPLADQLVALDLSGIRMSEEMVAALGTFQNLTRLHLENTETTDAGIAHVVRLPYLEYLNLYGNPVTDEGVKLLARVPYLRKLYLWQTKVTPAGVALLEENEKLQVISGFSTGTDEAKDEPETRNAQ